MRMMNELKHLFLYSANKKVYVPIDTNNKRKNSAILLLTPSLEISNSLMTLPYLYNPDLFTSFYVDRNVSAYVNNVGIENIEFDEKEENAISEAMVLYSMANTKFKIDENTSTMDLKYIRDVYYKDTVKYYSNLIGIMKVPDRINVVVYPTLHNLEAATNCNNTLAPYFHFDGETIHVLSNMVYDGYTMCGTYNNYLLSALLYALIKCFNKKIPDPIALAIAYSQSGTIDFIENERNDIDGTPIIELAAAIKNNIEKSGYSFLRNYIRSGDPSYIIKVAAYNTMNGIRKLFREETLSYTDRQRLLPSDFGIPNKRMYPIHNEAHVRAAIKMFNHCDPADEKELAEAIVKRMKRFGITDVNVGDDNRFKKYYDKAFGKKKAIHEGYLSLNACNGFKADYLSADNQHEEFKDKLIGVEFGDGFAGEVFTKDGELVAYYNSKKDDNKDVWITALKCMPGYEDAYSFLIGRAMDYQNASYVAVDKNNEEEYKRFKKFGFEEFNRDKDNILMSIKESEELDPNWLCVQSVCSHLSNDELGKITFEDQYYDSKFVIKRIIGQVGKKTPDGSTVTEPAGFLDVYQFPSNPSIAQIVIAVDDRYRGIGVANSMVNALISSKLEDTHNFAMYYWTAHKDNIASQRLAIKNGFIDTGRVDKYDRKIFIKKVGDDTNKPELTKSDLNSYEDAIVTENASFFFEADSNKAYSQKLRRYLYSERIKNNKSVLLIYDKIKAMNPDIRRTYIKLDMYKKYNLFVDLSYYHALFLKNNVYKMDKAVNLYFDFLNRLIGNREITSEYSKTTIFIPVDNGVWDVAPDSDIFDFRKNLNPISTIVRLLRMNPSVLKREWGNKDIIFMGSRGYFKVDFNKFELKNLARFKTNIRKLMSTTEPVIDDYEVDNTSDDSNTDAVSTVRNADTSKAIAAKIIDRIEKKTNIAIDNVSALGVKDPSIALDTSEHVGPHLTITKNNGFSTPVNKNDNIVIISLDPDGPDGFHDMTRTSMYTSTKRKINTYCMPNE